MSASAWFNEYQAAACPACAGDDRAIHIHEACALKAQTDLREALAEAREEVEEWKANHAAAEEGWMKAARKRDEAVAEVARMKEMLGELLDAQEHFDGTDEDHDRIEREDAWARLNQATKAARRVLGRTDGEG